MPRLAVGSRPPLALVGADRLGERLAVKQVGKALLDRRSRLSQRQLPGGQDADDLEDVVAQGDLDRACNEIAVKRARVRARLT